jgi:hypothetical protein
MFKPQVRCSIKGCPNDAHARGFCRCHYGRLWRGKPLCGAQARQEAPSSFNLQSLERQLADARRNHDLVIGLEGKMRWRHMIQELEQALSVARISLAKQHISVAAG